VAEPALERQEQIASLRELLQRKFPGIGVLDRPEYGVLPSGVVELDDLLPGGLPRGALTLMTGAPSCGKTAVALSFCAELTRQGGSVAWVHQGALSAASVAHAGVELSRLLAVRAESFDQARRCADFLLRWQAFHLVVVDWPGRGGRGAAWNRLHRLVTGSCEVLLVLAPPLPEGDPLRYCASLHAGVSRAGGSWGAVHVSLLKSRYQRIGRTAQLRPARMEGAPFELLPDLPGLGQDWHDEIG
jgi:hypothetical protein